METELIEHNIKIDDYTKVILSIPKEMDAMELKGIMQKANKLMSMSEISLKPRKKYTMSGKYSKENETGNSKWKAGRRGLFTDEQSNQISKIRKANGINKAEGYRELAKKFGLTYEQVKSKSKNLRSVGL